MEPLTVKPTSYGPIYLYVPKPPRLSLNVRPPCETGPSASHPSLLSLIRLKATSAAAIDGGAQRLKELTES